MAGETLITEIILSLEEYVRENGILHQQEEPKLGRSKQRGNQNILSTAILTMFKVMEITSEFFCTFSDKEYISWGFFFLNKEFICKNSLMTTKILACQALKEVFSIP